MRNIQPNTQRPESQTLGRKPLPSNVILGETAYSPGDHAVTLWPFYDPVFPVNVMAIGETKCRPDYHVIRPRSRIMAIEYIAQGAGILKINGQTYRPEQNCTILLTKHSAHSYEPTHKTHGKSIGLFLTGHLCKT